MSKIFYLRNPKAATGSIIHTLGTRSHIPLSWWTEKSRILKKGLNTVRRSRLDIFFDSVDWKNCELWTSIRHPLDRYIGGWQYCILRGHLSEDSDPVELLNLELEEPAKSFVNEHCFMPQWEILYTKDLVRRDVKVIRFEHLQDDFDNLAKRFGATNLTLIHNKLNESRQPNHVCLERFPDLEEAHRVKFKLDWELLGYS